MTCGVYFIQSPSGKMYVGSSEKVERRVDTHFRNLRRNEHPSRRLSRAFIKYNGEGFTHGILEACKSEQLEEREQFWIDTLKPNYNARTKATPNAGLRMTIEERRALSATLKTLNAEDPSLAQKRAEGSRRSWADPEKKAVRVATLKAAWTPEKRKAMADRMKGVDTGAPARAALWPKEGAKERASARSLKIWDKRGRTVTPDVIQAKVEGMGWEFVEISDGRVKLWCPKHNYSAAPTKQKLFYAGQGCRFCGFQRSSDKQIGRPKKKADACGA